MKKYLLILLLILPSLGGFSQTKLRLTQVEDITNAGIKSTGVTANKVLTSNNSTSSIWAFPSFTDLLNKPVAGIDYLTPTGSAASLTSFPTLNQNTTGSSAWSYGLYSFGHVNEPINREILKSGVYTYSSFTKTATNPSAYNEVIGFGTGASTVEISGDWLLGKGLAFRSLRDQTDAWSAWTRVWDYNSFTPTEQTAITHSNRTALDVVAGTNTGDNATNSLYSGLVTNATHTGDVTGSTALTLATVNAAVGTYNNVTVNAKGLVTGANNAGYLTSFTETDPNIYAWAKASVKPAYTYSEIGGTPALNYLPITGGAIVKTTGIGLIASFAMHSNFVGEGAEDYISVGYNDIRLGHHYMTTGLGSYGWLGNGSNQLLKIYTSGNSVEVSKGLLVLNGANFGNSYHQLNRNNLTNENMFLWQYNGAPRWYLGQRNKEDGFSLYSAAAGFDVLFFNSSGNAVFGGNATATNFILSSDRRLKRNIKTVSNIARPRWVTFEMKNDSTNRQRAGVIAQELEKTNPEFVYTDEKGMKSVAYIDLLITKIAELENRIKALENER